MIRIVTAPVYQSCPTCGGPTEPEYPAGMCPGCITQLGFVTTGDQPTGSTEWEQGREPFADHERAVIRHYELATRHIADALADGAGIIHGNPETMLLDAYRDPRAGRTQHEAIRWDLGVLVEWYEALRSGDEDTPVARTAAATAYWHQETRRYNTVANWAKDAALATLLDVEPPVRTA